MGLIPMYLRQLMNNYNGKKMLFLMKKTLWNFKWHLTPTELQVKRMRDLLDIYGIKGTFFTVANLIENHPERLKIFGDHHVQPHGYSHIQYNKLSFDEAYKDVSKAVDIFRDNGIHVKFFRAPYATPSLKDGKNWYDLLAMCDVPYGSSIEIRPPESNPRKIQTLGGKKDVYEIPITWPTDDLLIDYKEIRNLRNLTKTFLQIIKQGTKANNLINFCLHPLRMGNRQFVRVTEAILEGASKIKGLELASLENATKRRIEGEKTPFFVVTGDIDCWTYFDYIHRLKY